MTSRQIVVDDNAADRIQYTGNWSLVTGEKSQYGNSRPLQNTLHTTSEAASSFSFSFIGSSIRVYASILANATASPTWECYLDSIKLGSNKPGSQQNNFAICNQNTIRDGPHDITVNVTKPGTGFWFDYLIYVPASNVSFESATLRVNRLDREIDYDSGWSDLGGFANFTQETGATLKFDFFGSSLSWTGYVPKELAIAPSSATYSVDGAPPTHFTLNGLPDSNSSTMYNQLFFTTPKYPVGPHTLLVTHEGTKNQTPLTLNYLDIYDASSANSTTNTAPSPLATRPPAPRRALTTGAIIGVVIGVVCVVVFIFVVALLCRHRARYNPRADTQLKNARRASAITPFPSAPTPRRIEMSGVRISKSLSSASPSLGGHSPVESHPNSSSEVSESLAVDVHRDQIQPSHKSSPMRFHEDSGIRMSPGPRGFVDVPPLYTPS